jgi:hypothetical protein
MTVRRVVGVLGGEAMAVLAVGLAGLGMAGGGLAAVGATGSLEGDEASDDLLGLAAPDAVLLAGPDREGQAGIAHRAGRADGDGLSLELGAVGEERVVLGRDDIEQAASSRQQPTSVTPQSHLLAAWLPQCAWPGGP